MPKDLKAIRPGKPVWADMLQRLQESMVQVLTGGRGINVFRSGTKIVIERASNPIIPTGGGGIANNYGADIQGVGDANYEGDNNAVARDDHVHQMNVGALRYVGGVRIWWVDDEAARDDLVDHAYEYMGSYAGYPFCGDLCFQRDNYHLYLCRDTGTEYVWEGISHWEVSST